MDEKRTATIYYGGFAFRGGGAFMHAKVLRTELERAGWNVELITLESLLPPFRFIPHIVGRVVNQFNPPMGFYYKDRLTRFLYRRFFNRSTDFKIFEDIYLSWNSRTPSVTLLHAVWSDNLQSIVTHQGGVKRLVEAEERAIDSIDHPMITVSKAYCDFLVGSHGGSTRLQDVSVVPLGLDVSEFDIVDEAEHAEKSLVFCGSLESRKNVGLLMRVFRNIHEADGGYRLTIIGDGPDRAALERYAMQHELPVVFRGRLDKQEVIRELRKHSLYVHPSVKESFSFALLEAKMARLKTVAFEGLEVPAEFIDVAVPSFDEADWQTAIRHARATVPKEVDKNIYSSRTMMLSTVQLAFGSVQGVP